VDKGAEIDKFFQLLQPPALRLIVNGRPCCPELGLLSSASSPQAQEMRPLMPSSRVQVQGVQKWSLNSAFLFLLWRYLGSN